jgi:hypothetical protein
VQGSKIVPAVAAPTHDLMGGKLHVYKRENSRYWQCSTYLAAKNRRITTKEESLPVMRGQPHM